MGAFHRGHVSLMSRAREECGLVVVSLFVNPAQFNEAADLARYPRDEAGDAALAEQAGVDVFFAPDVGEVYPAGFATTVEVAGLPTPLAGAGPRTAHLCGGAAPGGQPFNHVQPPPAHFRPKGTRPR